MGDVCGLAKRLVGRGRGLFLARLRLFRQRTGVEKMEGLEDALRPLAAGIELEAGEIANFAEGAVANDAAVLTFGVADRHLGPEWELFVQLDAGSRKGDVLQIGHSPAAASGFILPPDIDQVGAEHSGFGASLNHHYPFIDRGFVFVQVRRCR